jgi:diguanylate cyclase (GGDEF)-like protein
VDAVPVLGTDGAPVQVVSSFTDITARRQAEAALADQALRDALTGLPNRMLLRDRLNQALHTAAHTRTAVALFLLDLNRFKAVNDTLGHHYGDLLLQQVGARIQDGLCSADTVARLGGDEFAVLLPDTDTAGAVRAAHKILAALSAPITVEEQCFTVSASIGVTLAPDHGTDATTLLRRADVAMYVAKRGRHSYAVYTPQQDRFTPERLALTEDLRLAIARGDLRLYYQPKIHLASGRVDGVEALVRWDHPSRGSIAPDHFIPLAEQTGQIGPLTRWVIEAALRQCHTWAQLGLHLGVAVNLSIANLHDVKLPDTIAVLLDAYGVAASDLRIEVTESMLMADVQRARAVLDRIAALGIGISVDDYGTGYSSLAHLKRLPVDELKIDRAFIQQMARDEADAAIVASTIGLGHSLGLRVVAEGVEDEATLHRLHCLGCDVAQGHYLGLPQPAHALEAWLLGAQRASA